MSTLNGSCITGSEVTPTSLRRERDIMYVLLYNKFKHGQNHSDGTLMQNALDQIGKQSAMYKLLAHDSSVMTRPIQLFRFLR